MRVEYTLPGMLPAVTRRFATHEVKRPSLFRSRLHVLSSQLPVSWRHVLRVDRPGPAQALLGPPPLPPTIEMRDVAGERVRWRDLLERHSRPFREPWGIAAVAAGIDAAGIRSMQRMIGVLLRLQELEDGVVARHLSETRG